MTSLAAAPVSPAAPVRTPRVLMLTHRLPYPPDRGDRIRSYHLLKVLAKHLDLDIACVSEEPVWLQHHQLLATMARRVAIMPISPTISKLRALSAAARGSAITPSYHFRQSLGEQILQWHEQKPFSAVLTFCTGMIDYARLLTANSAHDSRVARQATPRHVLDLVDVDSLKWSSYAQSTRLPMRWIYGAEARRLRTIEAGALDKLDAITVVSDNEARAYREHIQADAPLHVIRNGVDTEYFHPLPDADTRTVVFVGVLNYRPNAEGIAWFAQQVMPLLRTRVRDARLQIVGRHPTPAVEQLAAIPGVEVVGSVPDVRAYLRDATAVVAPLQIARGTQNKVLEGMACQRVAVCSPGAAGGIDAQDGQHLLVAHTPEQWADHLERVLQQSAYRQQLAAAARQRVLERYDWEQTLLPMVKLLAPEQ